jgi:hypothetical protein
MSMRPLSSEGSAGPAKPLGEDEPFRTVVDLYVRDIDAVSHEFGVRVDEEGLAGRQCNLSDPDGNRLRIATPRM